MQSSEGNDLIFVIEVCSNCKDCGWHTRHDPAKYEEYTARGKPVFTLLSGALGEGDPLMSRPGAKSILQLTCSFLCFSVQRNCRTYSGSNRHEKPDSQVVPAPRLVLQPDSQRGPKRGCLQPSPKDWSVRGILQRPCKSSSPPRLQAKC